MFKINNKNLNITFTGIDEFTNLDLLPNNVEYGILFSMNNITNRYPSLESIEKISKYLKERNYQLSLHVCGSEAKKMLINQNLSHIIGNFQRIQVNGKIKESKAHIICDLYPSLEIIFQYNESNKNLLETLNGRFKNLSFLLDNSGGNGISPEKWENPNKEWNFGYAGGLSHKNINEELNKILEVSNENFWIDMEGKIRNEEDKFDINKINDILRIIKTNS